MIFFSSFISLPATYGVFAKSASNLYPASFGYLIVNSKGAYSSTNFAVSLFSSSLFLPQPVSIKHKLIKIANTERIIFFIHFISS